MSSFEQLVECYQQRGMSPAAARQAAEGRAIDRPRESLTAAANERAAMLAEAYARRGLHPSGRPLTLSELVGPRTTPLREVAGSLASAAQARLGMTRPEAEAWTEDQYRRELAKGGEAHARTFLTRLSESMRGGR